MKKCFLALLCLMLLGGCALAENEGVIVGTACNIVQAEGHHLVYCFAQVHNNTDQVLCLDEGALQLSAGEELLAIEPVAKLWPPLIGPGEDGYLYDVVSFEAGEDGAAPGVTGINYDMRYMTIDPAYGAQALQAQAMIEPMETEGRMTVVCQVHNPTETIAYDAVVALGLYTEAGQLLYADAVTLSGVGIPAGSSVMVRFEVADTLAAQWQSYNALPQTARVNAMFGSNED